MMETMTEALAIPHLTYNEEVALDALVEIKASLAATPDLKLTYLSFFIKALSLAILQFPIVNSRFSDDLQSYTMLANHNISIAMDSPHGLFLPNIKNCEGKSIFDIANDLHDLSTKAATGQFGDEVEGGTIALSNTGTIGGTYNCPVIFPP
jgi:2-oxoisovalerate dehydrogenase E2 component (dihydrolipoyl transacylase)